VFEPLVFLAKLAALVPLPRAHLVTYHGVLAPASALRAAIVLQRRGLLTDAESSALEDLVHDRCDRVRWPRPREEPTCGWPPSS
jgi:hypothetical protein